MMDLVEKLLEDAAAAVRSVPEVAPQVPSFARPFRRIEWVPSLNAEAGVDVLTCGEPALRGLAERIGVEAAATISRTKLLDEMFQALVESKLKEPTFVVD